MADFLIEGKRIELDTSKTYLDFYWHGIQEGQLVQIDLERMVGAIQSGELPVDNCLREHMQYLRRWEKDAPRKRGLREMRRGGMSVLTTDDLFEEEGGEKIIDDLENTGVFAAYFLREVYGEK